MNKVKSKKTKAKNVIEMPVVNPYAAGINISDKEHVVAVSQGALERKLSQLKSDAA